FAPDGFTAGCGCVLVASAPSEELAAANGRRVLKSAFPWADARRRGAGGDPSERARPALRDDPPRRGRHRCRSPPPRPVGGSVRGARPGPLRGGEAYRLAAALRNSAGSGLGARRGRDVPGSRGGGPCDGGGKRPEGGSTVCRVRGRAGRG